MWNVAFFCNTEMLLVGKSSSIKPYLMQKVALRKGADVTRSRGRIVLFQVSDVVNDTEQSSTCTKSVNKV